jgi:hypothetical protein
MPTTLTYDPLPDGYNWNLREKIRLKIGYFPAHSRTTSHSYLNFDEDLTQQQIDDVDAIVGDGTNAQDPIEFATVNNTFILKDVHDWRDQLETDAGFEIAITYRQSGNKGDRYDEIVLQATDPTYQAQRILTNPQKNALENAVANLGRWE